MRDLRHVSKDVSAASGIRKINRNERRVVEPFGEPSGHKSVNRSGEEKTPKLGKPQHDGCQRAAKSAAPPGSLTLSFHVLFSQRQKRPCLALETQNSHMY